MYSVSLDNKEKNIYDSINPIKARIKNFLPSLMPTLCTAAHAI